MDSESKMTITMKGRTCFSLWLVSLVGIATAQTNITAGAFEFLEVEEKVFALFPEKAVLNRPEVVQDIMWDEKEQTLAIFTDYEPVTPANFAELFANVEKPRRRKMWTWKPGEVTAKETMNLDEKVGQEQFFSIPTTQWTILKTWYTETQIHTANRLTKISHSITLPEGVNSTIYSGRAGGSPLLVLEALEGIQIFSMSLTTGQWNPIPINLERREIKGFLFDDEKDWLLIDVFGLDTKVNDILIYDLRLGRVVKAIRGGDISALITNTEGPKETINFYAYTTPFWSKDAYRRIPRLEVKYGRPSTMEDAPEPPAFTIYGPVYGAVSPGNRFLAVRTSNMVGVREFGTIPKSQFLEIQREVEKSDLLNLGRRIGVSMYLYSSDNDQVLPPLAGWQESIQPYFKDSTGLEKFEYLLDGRSESDIEAPSETPLGRIKGKFGYVVVYADTSARWFPSP